MQTDHKVHDIDQQCRVFYLTVDPLSMMHAIPSLFYRQYCDILNDKMQVVDPNRNTIQLRIIKGYNTAYIVEGLDKLVYVYGLSHGGTIKLRFLFDDIFYVIKVKNDKMENVPIRYHYLKEPFSKKTSLKGKEVVPHDPFFDEVERFHNATYKPDKNRKITSQTKRSTMPKHGLFNKSKILHGVPISAHHHPRDSATTAGKNNIHKHLSKPLDIDLNVVPQIEDDVIQTMEHVSMNTIESCKGTVVAEVNKDTYPIIPFKDHEFPHASNEDQFVNLPNHPFNYAEFNGPSFVHFMPMHWPRNSHYFKRVCLIAIRNIQASFVVLPPRFARSAFPSRLDYVRVIQVGGIEQTMGIRWTFISTFVEDVLTRGWKAFVRNNLLRPGSILRFIVISLDETVMYVELLKL